MSREMNRAINNNAAIRDMVPLAIYQILNPETVTEDGTEQAETSQISSYVRKWRPPLVMRPLRPGNTTELYFGTRPNIIREVVYHEIALQFRTSISSEERFE